MMQRLYVKGEYNTVADTLSCVPSASNILVEVEASATHAYTHCAFNEEDMVASISPAFCSPTWEVAYSLADIDHCKLRSTMTNQVCAMLSISADKSLLDEIQTGYENNKWVKDSLAKAKDGMPGI